MQVYKASTEKEHTFIPTTSLELAREKAEWIFKSDESITVREAFPEELKCLPSKL